MKALLLAAGFGTRFKPHTQHLAKPALPLLNLPLMAYPFYHLLNLGLDALVINTHHLPKTIHQACKNILPKDLPVQFSHEDPEILNSGGGIAQAKPYLFGTDFCVANADGVMFFNHSDGLKKAYEQHLEKKALATLVTTHHPQIGQEISAVWTDDSNIKGFGKDKFETGFIPEHYTGFMILSSQIFDYLPKKASHIFLDGIMPAVQAGEKVITYFDPNILWFELGHEQGYLQATSLLIEHLFKHDIYGKSLLKLLKHFHPSADFLRENIFGFSDFKTKTPMITGKNIIISENTDFKGFAVIGDNCHISAMVDSSVVHSHALIDKALVNNFVI